MFYTKKRIKHRFKLKTWNNLKWEVTLKVLQ